MFMLAFPLLSIILQILVVLAIISMIVESRNKNGIDFDKYIEYTKKFAHAFFVIAIISIIASIFFGVLPLRLLDILLYFLLTSVAIALAAQVFKQLSDRLPNVVLMILFVLTIISLISVTIHFVNTPGEMAFTGWLVHIVSSASIILAVAIFAYLISWAFPDNWRKGRKTSARRKKAPPTLMQHYYDSGLNDAEIKYFREQMDEMRQNIYSLEEQMNQTAKLRAVDVRHNTINISKELFQDLVSDPKRISEASKVMYRILPSLNDLSKKYNEVNDHIAKNKQTYIILEKSAKTIEELAIALTDEYLVFHKATFNDLEDEVNLAKRNLNKNSDWDSLHSIDEILEDFHHNNGEDKENE